MNLEINSKLSKAPITNIFFLFGKFMAKKNHFSNHFFRNIISSPFQFVFLCCCQSFNQNIFLSWRKSFQNVFVENWLYLSKAICCVSDNFVLYSNQSKNIIWREWRFKSVIIRSKLLIKKVVFLSKNKKALSSCNQKSNQNWYDKKELNSIWN